MNDHNKRLAQQGRKRRTLIRKLRESGWTVIAIARTQRISRARVYQLLGKNP